MRLPAQLLQRKLNTHKKDFGHVFILAGSPGLSGAAILCSQAAMRSGCGMATLGIPKSLNTAMEIKLTEVMTKPLAETEQLTLSPKALANIRKFSGGVNVLALGPGLSTNRLTQALIRTLILSIDKPMVIDADGLNALVGYLDDFKLQAQRLKSVRVLTPHPGEMARLLGVTTDFVQRKREGIAKKFAKEHNTIVVLKGHKTIVVSPKEEIYINKTGNPGMATAGSGDVLTGIITSFIGQGLKAFEAAKFAVYIHGLAGDLAAKEKGELGLIASDIVEKIPKAIIAN